MSRCLGNLRAPRLAQLQARRCQRRACAAAAPLLEPPASRTAQLAAERRSRSALASTPTVAAPPPSPPNGSDEQEYFLQCGVAIRTLRDELPLVFDRELTADIYRPDVAFVDHIGLPGVPGEAHGREAYKRVFSALRLHGALCFARQRVALLRIWQPRDRVLAVRWSVAATPRVLGSLGVMGDVHFDGISEYKLDSRGLIYEHTLENCDFGTQQPAKAQLAALLERVLAPIGAQPGVPSFHRASDASRP